MSKNIFSTVDSGVKVYRSRFNLSYRHTTTCDYGALVPIMAKFCLPGDVWKCGANILARYQPLFSPSFTRSWIKMRYFFVPLRLIEPNFEQVVTGSIEGHLSTSIPVECFSDNHNFLSEDYNFSQHFRMT